MSCGTCFPEILPTAPAHTLFRNTPPPLRLSRPEHGWIDLFIGEAGPFAPVSLSNVYPPLADLWYWSCALALGLLPATVRVYDESEYFFLSAERVNDGALRLRALRTVYDSPEAGAPGACLVWEEPRRDFLRRWGRMWADWAAASDTDWSQWEEEDVPEPMLDMPWEALADWPDERPAPWPRNALVGWFWLLMAHQLPSRGRRGCEYLDDPGRWVLRELALADLTLDVLHRAWTVLDDGAAPDGGECRRLIDVARDLAHGEDLPQPEAHDVFAGLGEPLDRAYYRAQAAVFDDRERITGELLPRFPIAPGSAFTDAGGRSVSLIEARGRRWFVFRDDGQVNEEDVFHLVGGALWRWPLADGPHFDARRLDAIDRRRLAFMRLQVSPVRLVCPCCGYPCMEDDQNEVQSCEICAWPLWPLLHGRLPGLDDTTDAGGDSIRPTLREARRHFLDHGDAYPLNEPEPSEWLQTLRAHQELAAACRAEWDAWLANPDPERLPEEVWRRENRARNPETNA